jgi:hypothetical protein
MESSSSRREEGWTNGPILQTIAAHLTKMKHWTRLNKDATVAWYSYTYKFFDVRCYLLIGEKTRVSDMLI